MSHEIQLLSVKQPQTRSLSLFSRVKQLLSEQFYPLNAAPSSLQYLVLPRSKINYAKEVGTGLGSSVLMSPIKWVQRTFPEARLDLMKQTDPETEVRIPDHELIELLQAPNTFYSGDDLFAAIIFSFITDGNGYVIKKRKNRSNVEWWRNVADEIEALWYVPHWMMQPQSPIDGTQFISHYRYSVGGKTYDLPPENVVHIRNGLDPRDPRRGMSLIESELREIFTDDEAANFVAALTKNMGIPGVVISPKTGMPLIDEPKRDAIKEMYMQKFTGDRRGEPLVLSGAVDVSEFGFDPKRMALVDQRDTAEERICSAIGIPAAVVGFGSGLQQTKVGATMNELVRMAWVGCLIPMQKTFALQIGKCLIFEYEPKPKLFRLLFNQTTVAAMQENMESVARRVIAQVQGGIMTVSAAQQACGIPVDPTQNVYLRSFNMIEVQATDPKRTAEKRRKEATRVEQQVIDTAPDGKPSRDQQKLMRRFTRDAISLGKEFEPQVASIFANMGDELAELTLDVLEREKARKATNVKLTVDEIIKLFDFDPVEKELADTYGAHYLSVAQSTYKTIQEVIGLAVDIPDARAQEIVSTGGRRVGLLDLTQHTRKRLFSELTAGLEAGEGPAELARRVREVVPAGPFTSIETRSRVIARTETLHAQRMSALEAYRAADNVDEVMVFDNRTGYDDPECAALDGKIVTFDEAWELMNDEHPNGTRSFAPVVGERS